MRIVCYDNTIWDYILTLLLFHIITLCYNHITLYLQIIILIFHYCHALDGSYYHIYIRQITITLSLAHYTYTIGLAYNMDGLKDITWGQFKLYYKLILSF